MSRSRVGVVLLAVAFGLAGAARARADEVDPDDLVKRLARVRRAVEDEVTSIRETGEADSARVRRAGESLDHLEVRVPGRRDPIPADPGLARDLDELDRDATNAGREEKLRRLAKKFSSLEQEARRARDKIATAPPPRPDEPEADPSDSRPAAGDKPRARDALDKVLADPKYKKRTAADAEKFGVQERLDSVLQRIENAWSRFLQPPSVSPTMPAWLTAIGNFIASILPRGLWGYVAWALGAALLIALLVWLRRRRKRTEPDEMAASEVDVGPTGTATARPEESYSEEWWRKEARALAQRGELRGAVRALYTGVLLLLQRAGRLKFDKGKTNWEHVRDLRKNDKQLALRLEPLTRTFDLVWYGQKPIETKSFESFWGQAHAFAAEAGLASDEPAPEL